MILEAFCTAGFLLRTLGKHFNPTTVQWCLSFSPWLCGAGNCELVYPAWASQRVWGWILWAACWRAAPAPSLASPPAGAPSSAAPTDVPGKQTSAAARWALSWETLPRRENCHKACTVVLAHPVSVFQRIQLSAWIVPQRFLWRDLFQHLCNRHNNNNNKSFNLRK